jgi:hypothetical protein
LVYANSFSSKTLKNNRKEKPIVNSNMAELDKFVFIYTKSTKFLKLIEFTKQNSNMMYENHYNLMINILIQDKLILSYAHQ